MANLNHLSERDIVQRVFEGAEPGECRGLSDVFTEDEILSLVSHPEFDYFSDNFRDWVWGFVDSVIERDTTEMLMANEELIREAAWAEYEEQQRAES